MGWNTLSLQSRESLLSFYWDRGESRLDLLIPQVSEAEEAPATCFKLISNHRQRYEQPDKQDRCIPPPPPPPPPKRRIFVDAQQRSCRMAANFFVSPAWVHKFLWFSPLQSGRSWRVEPSLTLRTDNLLHKPSVLCCLSTRAECMDYWCQQRASKAWHMARTHQSHMLHDPPSSSVRRVEYCRFRRRLLQRFSGDSLFLAHHPPTPELWFHTACLTVNTRVFLSMLRNACMD